MGAALLAVCLVFASVGVAPAETWTNRSGRAFSARLLAVDDTTATFVFAEDGLTNRLALAKLSAACARRACDRFAFAPVPPRLAATWNRAAADLRRIAELREDGLLTAERAARRRATVLKVFSDVAREKGIEPDAIERLIRRMP
jgi:multidrug resistance efflux pump